MARQRFSTNSAYKCIDPSVTVSTTNLNPIIADKSSVYMCTPTFITDEEWVECPSQLRDFVN
jgi:hypothetical protein